MFWKKKKPERVLRKFDIPGEQLEKYFTLYDAALTGSHLGKYKFWKFVHELFPECSDGKWRAETPNATSAYIIEREK